MIWLHCWSDVDLHLVDRLLVGADLRRSARVLVLSSSSIDRARQLRLHEAAHREHAAADRLHLGVELLVRVFGHAILSA